MNLFSPNILYAPFILMANNFGTYFKQASDRHCKRIQELSHDKVMSSFTTKIYNVFTSWFNKDVQMYALFDDAERSLYYSKSTQYSVAVDHNQLKFGQHIMDYLRNDPFTQTFELDDFTDFRHKLQLVMIQISAQYEGLKCEFGIIKEENGNDYYKFMLKIVISENDDHSLSATLQIIMFV